MRSPPKPSQLCARGNLDHAESRQVRSCGWSSSSRPGPVQKMSQASSAEAGIGTVNPWVWRRGKRRTTASHHQGCKYTKTHTCIENVTSQFSRSWHWHCQALITEDQRRTNYPHCNTWVWRRGKRRTTTGLLSHPKPIMTNSRYGF